VVGAVCWMAGTDSGVVVAHGHGSEEHGQSANARMLEGNASWAEPGLDWVSA
jgi:hypothetical protein